MLKMLMAAGGKELYGYGIVEDSEGLLSRNGIYTVLTRMEDKGLVESRKEKVADDYRGIPRRLYKSTGLGQRLLQSHELREEAFTSRFGGAH